MRKESKYPSAANRGMLMADKSVKGNEDRFAKRIYNLSAGGLAITFTVFSFMATSGMTINWKVASLILAFYVIIIIADTITIIKARNKAKDVFIYLRKRVRSRDEIGERAVNDLFDSPNNSIFISGLLIFILLLINIVATLIYSIYVFINN